MSNNTAPDSWESQADSTSAGNSPSHNTDVTAKFSTLNVNAVEFVPSFSFGKSAVSVDDEMSPTQPAEESPTHSPILNGKNPVRSGLILIFFFYLTLSGVFRD